MCVCVSLPIYARRPVILTSYPHRFSRVVDLKFFFVAQHLPCARGMYSPPDIEFLPVGYQRSWVF